MSEIFNPKIPAIIPVEGFASGSRLRLVLLPTQGARFRVNFNSKHNIALHFNPRFDEMAVVNNSTRDGYWQDENRFAQQFQRGRIYTVEFVSDSGVIHILINGNHFADFVERIPFNQVRLIEIDGGVHVHSAHITH